ncbi:Uncharacterised protein [Vibrio cholerae]|nr:Uncharacterised protein [Vibrio cholerae]
MIRKRFISDEALFYCLLCDSHLAADVCYHTALLSFRRDIRLESTNQTPCRTGQSWAGIRENTP